MPRPAPRGQQTRQLILDTALGEFAARGFAAVTVEEIAGAAGVTKGAVYHWFADKDDIGRELQHQLNERLALVAMATFDVEGDVVENLLRGFGVWLDLLGDHDEARFFLRDAWVIPSLDEAGRRDHDDATELVVAVLRRAVARGDLLALDPELLAHALMGLWSSVTLHVLRTGDRAAALDVIRHLIEPLRPEPRPASAPRRRTARSKGATP